MPDIDWSLAYNPRNLATYSQDTLKGANEIQQGQQSLAINQARPQLNQMVQNGDLQGAQHAALGTGDFDYIKQIQALDQNQKAQVQEKLAHAASTAYGLLGVKDPAQRAAIYNTQAKPALRQYGWSDADLDHVDLSDAGLNTLISQGQSIADNIKNLHDDREFSYKVNKDDLDRQEKRDQPITAADGAVLHRTADGSYETLYTPGTKPLQQITTDANGTPILVNVAGQPGQSYQSGGGGGYDTVLGNGRFGSPSTPLTSMTIGQAHDFGQNVLIPATRNNAQLGLAGTGKGSSAVGRYQIVSKTLENVAPRVFGEGWRNVAFNPENQDRLGEAIFNDAVSRGQNLSQVWTSLSPSQAAQVARMPWSQARDIIAGGESGGGRSSVRASMSTGQPRFSTGGGAPAQGGPQNMGNGVQVTSLGGDTGPLYRDEVRNINGQQIAGQVTLQGKERGKFTPYPGAAGKPAQDMGQAMDNLNSTIDLTERLYRHPGLSDVVGVPSLTGGLLGGKIIPGTNAAGFKSLMDNFDAKAYLSQVTQMRGMGALSDAEGKRLSNAIGSLNTSQSEDEFKKNLVLVHNTLIAARNRLQAKNRPNGSGQPGQSSGGGPVRVSSAAEARQLAPGTHFITPDGRTLIR